MKPGDRVKPSAEANKLEIFRDRTRHGTITSVGFDTVGVRWDGTTRPRVCAKKFVTLVVESNQFRVQS